MLTDEELDVIVDRCGPATDVTFLHCISAYPTPLDEIDVARMTRLAVRTERPVGLSDHTLGSEAAAAAIALGAVAIEKHVTWSVTAPEPITRHRSGRGGCRRVGRRVCGPCTAASTIRTRALPKRTTGVLSARRSTRCVYLRAGEPIRGCDLLPLRPLADGIPAFRRDAVVGRRLRCDVAAGAIVPVEAVE